MATSETKPLIGITGGLIRNSSGPLVCQVGQAYMSAILVAGGLPVIVSAGMDEPALADLLSKLDGVLLSGGGDIDPARFDGTPHPRVYGVSPERDAMEFFLVKRAVAEDKPLLAICRGAQVLNVALGGTLYTHIADQKANAIKHDWFPDYPRDRLAHPVTIKCGSRLDQIFDADEIEVNSLHHQGIARVGRGLMATAFAHDGLVEGVEVEGAAFALGVQWHPECLPDDPGMQRLLRAFVTACA